MAQDEQNHPLYEEHQQLTNEEVNDFFSTLAKSVIESGGMTKADRNAIMLNENDELSKETLLGWWKGALSESRGYYDGTTVPLRSLKSSN